MNYMKDANRKQINEKLFQQENENILRIEIVREIIEQIKNINWKIKKISILIFYLLDEFFLFAIYRIYIFLIFTMNDEKNE